MHALPNWLGRAPYPEQAMRASRPSARTTLLMGEVTSVQSAKAWQQGRSVQGSMGGRRRRDRRAGAAFAEARIAPSVQSAAAAALRANSETHAWSEWPGGSAGCP